MHVYDQLMLGLAILLHAIATVLNELLGIKGSFEKSFPLRYMRVDLI